MPYQTTVGASIPAGYIGEAALDGPSRVQPAILLSGTPANNIMGRAFTVADGGTGQPLASAPGAHPVQLKAQAGGAGVFAGILISPKTHAQASLTQAGLGALANGVAVELAEEHPGLFLQVPGACGVGDLVYFLTATGALVTAARTANAPANANTTPIGEVVRYDVATAGGGLAVIRIGAVNRPSATA